jgi:hypothetical protein
LTHDFRSLSGIGFPLSGGRRKRFLAFASLDPTPWGEARHAAGAPDLHSEDYANALLAWYGRNRRILPWRAAPGVAQDPYLVWLSEIMLQQTTVKAVLPRYAQFLRRWPDVRALAAAITPGRGTCTPAPARW